MSPDAQRFAFPVVPRYAEVDQQGVVFNSHYLIWFDEAFTAFLDHLGLPYPQLIADGCDVMVVHTELDFAAPVRWRDTVRIAVTCDRVGSTSFVLRFGVRRRGAGDDDEVEAVVGRTVYVCVDPADHAKRPMPERVAAALSGPPSGAYRSAVTVPLDDGIVTGDPFGDAAAWVDRFAAHLGGQVRALLPEDRELTVAARAIRVADRRDGTGFTLELPPGPPAPEAAYADRALRDVQDEVASHLRRAWPQTADGTALTARAEASERGIELRFTPAIGDDGAIALAPFLVTG